MVEEEIQMTEAEILRIFTQAKAITVNGHFVYTGGEHANTYVNKDAIYARTKLVSMLCIELAGRFIDDDIDVVVGPAIGGVILSQWTAYHLSALSGREVCAVYAEKYNDEFVIRRNYPTLVKGRRVLVVEDIINSGFSAFKTIDAVRNIEGKVVGLGALCTYGRVTREQLGSPRFTALINLPEIQPDVHMWEADECPLCKAGVQLNTNVGHGGKPTS